MRVQDEELWSVQVKEFQADEMSRKFYDFLVLWCEAAEKILNEYQQTPIGSLKKAFNVAEQTLGFISVEWLSQMLLVVVQHWVYGEEIWESLSVWERRMVEQATALKLTELQESAKLTEDHPQDDQGE
jgi:hypothetical protein